MSKSRDIADSAATINYIDNVTSDVQSQINTLDTALDNISVTSGTLTKTFAQNETASINLTSSVLAPVVSVTKEVPQSGVTNNSWDVNSTTENYTRLDSAYATTLGWAGDLSSASLSSSFSVAAQETTPIGMAFNSSGTKMFVVGLVGRDVNEYALSTAWDTSTASYVQSFSVASQEIYPKGITFNSDGTKMFVCGEQGQDVNEYVLSTAYDISTASYAQNFSVAAQDTNPYAIRFNTDGTKMFVMGVTGKDINEYSLSTGYDVSTASYTQNFSFTVQDNAPIAFDFNATGTKLFLIGAVNRRVFQYSLATAFDVSTLSYDSVNFSYAAEDSDMYAIAIKSDGSAIYTVGAAGDKVYQYSLPVLLALGTGSFASADVGKTIEANSGVFVLTATDGSYVETTAPTSYAQVASGSWSMYGVVYNATDGDLELSGYLPAYEIAQATFVDSFSVASQDSTPRGVSFSSDGTKMYIMGRANTSVFQYNLSTAFDVSTASYSGSSYNVGTQQSIPNGVAISADGTKMFVVGSGADAVHEYTLSTAFSVGTASLSATFSTAAYDSALRSITFNSDGTKMFVVGETGNDVNQFTLSTGFSVSTASYDGNFNFDAQDLRVMGTAFSIDGTKMLVTGDTSDAVYKYILSTAFDVTTATYSASFSVAAQDSFPWGIAFSSDGLKMFVVGETGDDVNEYSLGTAAILTGYHPVHTTTSTDTTYWTDINSMTADQNAGDGNVYYAISTDDRTTWTVIDNTDGERDIVRNNAGTWQYNSNGTYALETWVNGTTNTELATLAEAMEGAEGGIGIGFDLGEATYTGNSFSVSGQVTPVGEAEVVFSSDGTRMFVVSYNDDAVFQYSLSTAWDVTTASYDSISLSVAAQETAPLGMAISSDGTKLYVCGNSNDTVYQYNMTTANDLSTASYASKSMSVSQETNPRGLVFSSDGSKAYIVGVDNDRVYQYTLSTPWDVSTGSYASKSMLVQSQEGNPCGLSISSDGTKVFIVGSDNDTIYQYNLSTAYDVSTGSYSGVSFSVASQDGTPRGLTFSSDGIYMYIVGQSNRSVYQYQTEQLGFINQMDKTQLDAVTDPNHIALGNDLDLAIVFNMTSGTTVPSSDGVAINYDANVLNKGAVLGTDYDFDAPTQNSVRITALAANNLKVRVV